MLISDEVRKCVVFIGYRKNTGDMSLQGTGFFISRDVEGTNRMFVYLVTAKHVIQGIQSMENFDGKILLRMNFVDGKAGTVETEIDGWHFHPDESEIDVAVYPHLVISDLRRTEDRDNVGPEAMVIPLERFVDEKLKETHSIGIGDEVFLSGLFSNHYGRQKNIPIVRVGNIAAMPYEEKIRTDLGFMDGYLVEARSIGGLSGSPVFIHFGNVRHILGETKIATEKYGQFSLLGLMHGHWNVNLLDGTTDSIEIAKREAINTGIAIVVPIEKVLEVVRQDSIQSVESELENQARDEFANVRGIG
jgi:hypothetical protein